MSPSTLVRKRSRSMLRFCWVLAAVLKTREPTTLGRPSTRTTVILPQLRVAATIRLPTAAGIIGEGLLARAPTAMARPGPPGFGQWNAGGSPKTIAFAVPQPAVASARHSAGAVTRMSWGSFMGIAGGPGGAAVGQKSAWWPRGPRPPRGRGTAMPGPAAGWRAASAPRRCRGWAAAARAAGDRWAAE